MRSVPLVSVVVITFNRASLLKRALNSVFKQTFQNFEVVLVDDASNDNTLEVISDFSDERIIYIRHDENKGEAISRNTGVRNVKGKYIAFLDDDDVWLPEKLQLQVGLLNNSSEDTGAVYSGFRELDIATSQVISTFTPQKSGLIFQHLLKGNFITISSILLKKTCFDNAGFFDETIAYGLDYDMWLRISEKYKFIYIGEPLVNYSIHKNRLSFNWDIQIRGSEKILNKYSKSFAVNPESLCSQYYKLGKLYFLNRNSLMGRRFFLKALKLNPAQIRIYLIIFLSYVAGGYLHKKLEKQF